MKGQPMFRSSVGNAPAGCRDGNYHETLIEFRCPYCTNEWAAPAFWQWGALHLINEEARYCVVCRTEGEQQ